MSIMDLQTFQQKVLPTRDKLYRIALQMLRHEADAEDEVQGTMLRLWEMRDVLSGYRSVEALSVRMLKNTCINRLKAKREFDCPSDEMPEPGLSLDEAFEIKDRAALVARIIERLPDMQRLVIQMHDVEGYPLDEIAAITGCEHTAVRMNLSRARKKVRDIYFKITNSKENE